MSAELKEAVDMVNIEVDGIALQAPKGSMIIESTDKAGIEIPRFCYHEKLSISANCRIAVSGLLNSWETVETKSDFMRASSS